MLTHNTQKRQQQTGHPSSPIWSYHSLRIATLLLPRAMRQALFHIITDCTICLVTARIISILKMASHDSSDLILETMSNLCHLTLVKVAGEGGSKAGEATRIAGTGNQNGADGRECAWEAATIKGMAWPASPVATGGQGNPCSTGIRWGVSPAAQMGCLRNRSGSPSGADQP